MLISECQRLADELSHAIGRYHDEDAVDRRFGDAVRLLRGADKQAEDAYSQIAALASRDPNTGMEWVPLTTVAAVLRGPTRPAAVEDR